MAKQEYASKFEFIQLMADYEAHGRDSAKREDRISALEEELMGNQKTGRPPLRTELGDQIKSLKKIALAILTALIIGIVGNWIGLGNHSDVKADQQQTPSK